MIGVVGFDWGFRPAIALTDVPRPVPEEEEEEIGCREAYGPTLLATISDFAGCGGFGATGQFEEISFTGLNGAFTLSWDAGDTPSWMLADIGTITVMEYTDETRTTPVGEAVYFMSLFATCVDEGDPESEIGLFFGGFTSGYPTTLGPPFPETFNFGFSGAMGAVLSGNPACPGNVIGDGIATVEVA